MPENRSNSRVVTGKWLLSNEKLTARLKNKASKYLQIKNHKISHEIRMNRRQTQHKNPEHVYLKFLTPLTPSVGKKTESSCVQVSL
jgi:hypothetical protein